MLFPILARGQNVSEISRLVKKDDCGEVAQLIRLESRRAEAGKAGGSSALNRAVESGDVMLVKMFIDCGVDVNQKAADGTTPLMIAARSGNFEIVEMLNVPGIEINMKTRGGWTALHFAASSGCCQTVEFLMERGANVNARTRNGTTPLSIARVKNRQDAANLIKAYGGIE